jgi:PAS domain S-box-containing protein
MSGIIERLVRPFVKPVGNGGKRESRRLFEHIADIDRRLRNVEDERESSLIATAALFDHLPAFVIYKDMRDNLVFVNDYTASVVGKSVDELIGTPCRTLWANCLCNAIDEERVKRGEMAEGREALVELPDGEQHRLFVWERPVFDLARHVIGIVLFALDIDTICTRECPWKAKPT